MDIRPDICIYIYFIHICIHVFIQLYCTIQMKVRYLDSSVCLVPNAEIRSYVHTIYWVVSFTSMHKMVKCTCIWFHINCSLSGEFNLFIDHERYIEIDRIWKVFECTYKHPYVRRLNRLIEYSISENFVIYSIYN